MKQLNLENTKNYAELPKVDKIYTLEGTILTEQAPLFREQVRFLCNSFPTVEWSGILFYKVIGDFPNIKKIVLQEIFLMNKGTAGYTSYEFTPEVVEFIMERPHLENCSIGHIHSHNTMQTFFSGTDMDELKENCFNHVNYLSIIVNNMGSIAGKMVMVSKIETELRLPLKGNNSVLKLKEKLKQNILLVKNCEFSMYNEFKLIGEDFKARLKYIANKPTFQVGNIIKTNNNPYNNSFQQNFPVVNNNEKDFFEEEDEILGYAIELWLKVLTKFFKSKKDLDFIQWENNVIILKTIFNKYKDRKLLLDSFKKYINEIFIFEGNSLALDYIYDEIDSIIDEDDAEFTHFIDELLNFISHEV